MENILSKHLLKTKIIFGFFLAILIGTIIYTSQNRVLEKQITSLQRELKYLDYKVQLSNNGSIGLASVGGFLWDGLNRFGSTNYSSAIASNGTGQAESIPVLVYHGIVPRSDRFSITEDNFKDQMFALKRAGYETVSLEDFISFIEGKKSLPKKSFLLTFDDGRFDSYQGADPILKALGYEAVMYVASGKSLGPNTQNEYYLDEIHLQEMLESGRWEIGSHAVQTNGGFIPIDASGTQGNFLSNRMWLEEEGRLETADEYEERVREELAQSRLSLEELTGRNVESFSYPFGDYGQDGKNFEGAVPVVRAATQSNYKLAFRQDWPLQDTYSSNYIGEQNVYNLRRIEPSTDWSGEQLLANIETGAAKDLPHKDMFANNNGWKTIWGTINLGSDGLQIKSLETEGGAFTFLDGTRHWVDYMYKATIDREAGGYVSLFSRFRDNDNYVSCTFGVDTVKIDQKVNGRNTKLIETRNPIQVPEEEGVYAMSVSGRQVRCYKGRSIAAFTTSGTIPSSGGIGLRIWDGELNNASIRITDLEAVPANQAEDLLFTLPVYSRRAQ